MSYRSFAFPFLDRRVCHWLRHEELGQTVTLRVGKEDLSFRAPPDLEHGLTLRFAGRGRRLGRWRGDLLLHVRLNVGKNMLGELWLSDVQARQGGVHPWGERPTIRVRVPAGVKAGTVLRVRGHGESALPSWRRWFGKLPRGDLLLSLRCFEEAVAPPAIAVENLSTEMLGLEGWVYRQRDELRAALGKKLPPIAPTAEDVAAAFNRAGWRGVADRLCRHFGVDHLRLGFFEDPKLGNPGLCKSTLQGNHNAVHSAHYEIWVKSSLVNHPFMAAAILAHELCHVVLLRWLTPDPIGRVQRKLTPQETLEEERTVDLLVFLFGLGQFQVRIAQDARLTLGYFDQRNFNRMFHLLKQR